MDKLRLRVAHVKATVSEEELKTPDKVRGKFFKEPGMYEVEAKGLQTLTSKKGNTYSAIPIEDATGKTGSIMFNMVDKDGNKNIFKTQLLYKGFGFMWSQKQIELMWDELTELGPVLLAGKVQATLGYYGYNVWYEEKGVYTIRDFSKDKDGLKLEDAVNPGDVLIFSSEEAAKAYMVTNNMKLGGNNWTVERPSDGFEPTESQIEALNLIDSVISGEAPKPPPPPVVEAKPAPNKPAWMAKK
jgi:hypothetical protein